MQILNVYIVLRRGSWQSDPSGVEHSLVYSTPHIQYSSSNKLSEKLQVCFKSGRPLYSCLQCKKDTI
jgi:hypothetical protein